MLDTFFELVVLAGGLGGAYAAYQLVIAFISRRRIKARFVGETYDPKSEPNIEIRLEVEITNLGDKATALTPTVKISALDALTRSPLDIELTIESQRRLEPQTPNTIAASAVVGAAFVVSWYRRYTITISRGRRATIRHLNARHAPLGFFSYWYGYVRFRMSDDWVPEETGPD